MRAVLFVCSGNTCRSPMAEAIARHWVRHGGLGGAGDVLVASAGVFAGEGMAMSEETAATLERLGIDATGNGGSKPLTAQMVAGADIVLCMTSAHESAIAALVGDGGNVHRLDPAGDVPDPIGQGQDEYDALGQHLMELIPGRLEEVLGS